MRKEGTPVNQEQRLDAVIVGEGLFQSIPSSPLPLARPSVGLLMLTY